MKAINTVGIDIAKNVFHLICIDERGHELERKRLTRERFARFMANLAPARVYMEACGTAHHWGRVLCAMGHQVRLIHPTFVKAYLRGNKNDFNDAAAIAEAGSRPTMRFVPLKSIEQQDLVALHRARDLIIRQRTQQSNQIRGLLAERGLVTRTGSTALRKLIAEVLAPESQALTPAFREVLSQMSEHLNHLEEKKVFYDKKIAAACSQSEACKRLTTIPGIGPVCATALYAAVGHGHDFKNGRQMAAWLGLVPKQDTSGGKPRLLGISKRGDQYLRRQLIHGARAVACRASNQDPPRRRWIERLREKKALNVVAVALANKNTRIAWAILTSEQTYRENTQALAA